MSAPAAIPLQDHAKLIDRLWAAGDLSWKPWDYQLPVYDAVWRMIADPEVISGCVNVSRQFGKTHSLCIIALELGLLHPGAQIRFAAPTGIEMRKRTLPIFRGILADCPKRLRPVWNSQDKVWAFPNGSQIHIAGVNDGHLHDLRGSICHLGIVDEGAFIDELDSLVGDVLMPMTLNTDGTLIMASTPPMTLAHDYFALATECESAGNYVHRTIHDTGRSEKEIARYAKAAGGMGSTRWKREYLAQFVVEQELQVIPEWRTEYVADAEPHELRRFWHNYVALDIGATRRDFHAVLFGHYSFQAATLFVEDELIDSALPRMNTDALGRAIRAKELGLWGELPVKQRIADNNEVQMLIDLAEHGMPFKATSKDELPSMINKVRMWVKGGRIRVHPRCRNLLLCLERGIWKDEKHIGREFDRNTSLGHLDSLAALVYLVRNIDESTNPVPRDWGFDSDRQVWRNRPVREPLFDRPRRVA